MTDWDKLTFKRLLLTDSLTGISRKEWTLIEVSPSGIVGKFRNNENDSVFWTDLEELDLLEVLS